MSNIQDYIDSGILDLYVIGATSDEETIEVEIMASNNIEIQEEIHHIRAVLQALAATNSVTPGGTVKPFIFAGIDFIERMKNGESVVTPPVISSDTKIEDFNDWLLRDDMQLPADFIDYHIKIIYYTSEMICALVWIKNGAPAEVHRNEHEKLLIVEGSCEIVYGKNTQQFFPGDYFNVPLHTEHKVRVTSQVPCKVILQRIAA